MKWPLASLLISVPAELAVLAAAHFVGWEMGFVACSLSVTVGCFGGVILLGIAGWRLWYVANPRLADYAPGALFCYTLCLVGGDSQVQVHGNHGWKLFIGLLVPIVAGGVVFVRRKDFVAAAGALLFLFGCVVGLATNTANGLSWTFGFWNVMMY